MSVIRRIADSTRTSHQVREVPTSDIVAFLSSEAFLRDLEAETAVAKLTPTDRAGAQPARLAK